MDIKRAQKYVDYAIKGVAFIFLIVLIGALGTLEETKKPQEEIDEILANQEKYLFLLSQGKDVNENLPDQWPPKMNQLYPEIELIDQKGQAFRLSDLKGSLLVVEYIDITSPVSQAQSGARSFGVYGAANEFDARSLTFLEYFNKVGGDAVNFENFDVIAVKIIVYGEAGAAGSRDDAQNWADHFGMERDDGVIVAVPSKDLRGEKSDRLIGGYQLIDKNMLLRVDSSGPIPKHNLEMTFMPLFLKLLR